MLQVPQNRLEKRFMTTTVYKRSKQYFDINRLNKLQKEQQLSRRKPSRSNNQAIDSKLEQSFYSTSTKLYERVQTELSKCYTKSWKEDQDETQTNYTINNRKSKTIDMNKMLSRNYYQKQGGFNKNQNHFCNYHPYNMPNNHTVDFQKFVIPNHVNSLSFKPKQQVCSRCQSKQVQKIEQTPVITPPQIGKIRQKLHFDEAIFKTLIDLKKYDFQKSQRKQGEKTPQKNLEKIKVGQQLTKKRMKVGLVQFYHGKSKWSAPQMDNRLVKQNEYFLKAQNKLEQKLSDWTMLKRKTDLIENRKRQIMARKHIKDVKGQQCDQKFFRRNHF